MGDVLNSAIQEIAQELVTEGKTEGVLAAYRKALETHSVPILVVATDGTIRYLNSAALNLTHAISSRDVIGRKADEFGFMWNDGGVSVRERLRKGEATTFFELDGRGYSCTAAPLHDRLGNEAGVVEVVRPDGLAHSTDGIDELTGLSERSRFFSETRRMLDRNPQEHYGIIFWDVVRFKLINHVFSTSTGDMVLQNIASSIRSYVGERGTYGRLVEDHFAFCVPCDMIDMDWLKQHSEVTLISDTAVYTFKSTYGIYPITDRSIPVDVMCERAAHAQTLTLSKGPLGDVYYTFYTEEMHEQELEERGLASEMSLALAEEQITAFFQPIYDIDTGRVASAEALARWVHPEKGLVRPDRFIRLFEANGMITALDRHIWDQAAAFVERRLAAGKPAVPVSINVSRVDFFATTLVEELEDVVSSHNIPHELLRVEVTESAYTDDPERILEVVGHLRDLGFTVMLDDFGSGYSSLNTLKDMPLDILKLDMGFLRDFESSTASGTIIQHIVAMARELGLKVVAEGVETREQARFLLGVGCHLAQGFYYARPQPASDFDALLDAQATAEPILVVDEDGGDFVTA